MCCGTDSLSVCRTEVSVTILSFNFNLLTVLKRHTDNISSDILSCQSLKVNCSGFPVTVVEFTVMHICLFVNLWT